MISVIFATDYSKCNFCLEALLYLHDWSSFLIGSAMSSQSLHLLIHRKSTVGKMSFNCKKISVPESYFCVWFLSSCPQDSINHCRSMIKQWYHDLIIPAASEELHTGLLHRFFRSCSCGQCLSSSPVHPAQFPCPSPLPPQVVFLAFLPPIQPLSHVGMY